MYRPGDYLWMLTDDIRVRAYAEAIRAIVKPGSHVLEIGAGFGFFSVLAVRAGAAHVDAVDTNPVVHLGRHVADANDCRDRICFHHDDCSRLQLRRPADVIICDLRGPTPFCGRALATIIDARRRLLKPHGTIIAACDRVFVALSRAPSAFRSEVLEPRGREGVVMTPVERVVYDTPLRCIVSEEDLVSEGREWSRLDYTSISDVSHEGKAVWRVADEAMVDGLSIWFETDTGAGVGFSTKPGSGTRAYGQMFLPLRTPLPIAAGRKIRVTLSAHLVKEDYLWSWELATLDEAETRVLARQNSVAELVLDPAAFAPRARAAR